MASAPQELIEDREIAEFDDDQLGHAQIADQLVDLVASVPTPSNVALYGAWGSGKSGVGNLLRVKLKDRNELKFARFDAFKYAENPLRRNFVTVVATELGVKDRRFHDGLYSAQSSTDFHVPIRKVLRLVGTFVAVALVCATLATAAITFAAAVQGVDPVAQLLGIGAATIPVSLIPATLLTALIAFAGKAFVVERRVEQAGSDEEFEALLRDLVKAAGADRVVIFVDELDRCAPDDVVRTLDAVRTFFGVKGTIFVVAADQQVLEEALTRSLAQPTPTDSINPYYSAGSAYLDKVFQYQVSVPPLLPQSVTSFAVELLRDRPGIWQQVNREAIASILIPAHVRSPRRVKNLLNTFAMTYRLASARQEGGHLNVDVSKYIDELARLVCLKVEFPLFARDLVAEPNLSNYVRDLSELGSGEIDAYWAKHPYVSAEVKRVAESYALGERAVDTLLLDTTADGSNDDRVESTAAVTRVHGQQLLDYLRRTRLISGPTKSLIHLESIGALFNLPAVVAEQLERDGQNASFGSLQALYEVLDDAQRDAALDLLAQAARSAIGLEAVNTAMSIMYLMGTSIEVSTERADALTPIVAEVFVGHPEYITANTAAGAWNLACLSERAEANALGALTLASDLAVTDDNLFAAIVNSAVRAGEVDPTRAARIFVDRLFSDPRAVVDLVLKVPAQSQLAILMISQEQLAKSLQDAFSAFDSHQKAKEEAAKPGASSRRAAGTPVPDEVDMELGGPPDPEETLNEIARLVVGLAGNRAASETITNALLVANDKRARDKVASLLSELKPVSNPSLLLAILDAVITKRTLKDWPNWLDVIDPVAFSALPEPESHLKRLGAKLLADGAKDLQVLRTAAASTSRLLDHIEPTAMEIFTASTVRLGDAVADESEIEGAQHQAAVAAVLVECGLSQEGALFEARVVRLIGSLRQDSVEQVVESAMAEWVLAETRLVLGDVEASSRGAMIKALLEAIDNCPWLSEFDHARLRTAAASAIAPSLQSLLSLPDVETISLYKADLGEQAFVQLVADWLAVAEGDFHEVSAFIQSELADSTVARLGTAVLEWSKKLSESDRYAFLSSYIADPGAAVPSPPMLTAVGIADVTDGDVASILIDRYRRETSNIDRQKVLDLWSCASITDEGAKRRLIKEIYVPMMGLNSQAGSIALRYAVDLLKPVPRGSRKLLGDAVVQAIGNSKDLENRALKALKELGYPVKGVFKKKVNTGT